MFERNKEDEKLIGLWIAFIAGTDCKAKLESYEKNKSIVAFLEVLFAITKILEKSSLDKEVMTYVYIELLKELTQLKADKNDGKYFDLARSYIDKFRYQIEIKHFLAEKRQIIYQIGSINAERPFDPIVSYSARYFGYPRLGFWSFFKSFNTPIRRVLNGLSAITLISLGMRLEHAVECPESMEKPGLFITSIVGIFLLFSIEQFQNLISPMEMEITEKKQMLQVLDNKIEDTLSKDKCNGPFY